ncbi:MAG: Ig-like domain-containing protein [Gemmatimonadaceae bacterium]
MLKLAASAPLLAACYRDPTQPAAIELRPHSATPSVISRQGALRVVFNAPVQASSALDPQNFVVINQCNGLRVNGALRMNGDTLIFSPSQALPYLTQLGVRVQNVLDAQGNALRDPLLFSVLTESPPVSDVSWEPLASPTSDFGSGISFVSPSVGYLTTTAGAVYRTDDGGVTFAARFKLPSVIGTRDVRAASPDTVYVVGTVSDNVSTAPNLLRSVDGGRTFASIYSNSSAGFASLSLHRRPASQPLFLIGGSQSGSLAAFLHDGETASTTTFGPVGGSVFANMADMGPRGTSAAIAGFTADASFTTLRGAAYLSRTGGTPFEAVDLPPSTPQLRGLGFVDDGTALLLGDSSTVLRLDAATGGLTKLGQDDGIPQTETDPEASTTTVYTFVRAAFAPDDRRVGWIIGYLTRRRAGTPDVRQGVILISRDGGHTFARQAVRGAADNGVGFPALRDISVLDKSFAAVTGETGFVAARKSDVQNFATVCSFATP